MDVCGLVVVVLGLVAQASAFRHFCVIKEPDKTFHCWGSNAFGQVGVGTISRKEVGPSAAIAFGDASLTVQDFALGTASTCVLLSDLSVRCWGANDDGQLGYGLSTETLGESADELALLGTQVTAGVSCLDSVELTSGVNAGNTVVVLKCPIFKGVDFAGDVPVRLAGGGSTFCILTSAGNARCWGSGQNGVSGYGDTLDRSSPGERLDFLGSRIARLAVSDSISCAVTVDSSLLCWGSNDEGALGLGLIASSNVSAIFTSETDPNGCWDTSVEAGRLLCPTVYPVTLPGELAQVAVGGGSACVVMTDGLAYCWGDCDDGQCGYAHTDANGFTGDNGCWRLTGSGSNLFCPPSVPIDVDGTASLFESGGSPSGVVEALSTFADHTCARLSSGDVKCWGDNLRGELGYGVRPPILGGSANGFNYPYIADCTIDVDCPTDPCKLSTGDLMCPGPTPASVGEPIECFLNQAFESDTSSSDGVCAVATSGNLYCWGVNSVGEVGIVGGSSVEPSPQLVDLGTGNTVACGASSVVSTEGCDDANVDPVALTLLPFIRTDTSSGTSRPRLQSGSLVLEVAFPALLSGRSVSKLEFDGSTDDSACNWSPSNSGPWTAVTDVDLEDDSTCFDDGLESTGLSMSSLGVCGFVKTTTDDAGDRLRLDVNGDGVVGDAEYAVKYSGVMRITLVDTMASSVLSPPSAPRASAAQRNSVVTTFVDVVLPDDPTFTVDLNMHAPVQLYAMLAGQAYTASDPSLAGTLALTIKVDSPAPLYVDPSTALTFDAGSSTVPADADLAVAVTAPSFPSDDCPQGDTAACVQDFGVDVTFTSQAAFEGFCAATADGALHAVLAFTYTLTCRTPPGTDGGCPLDTTDATGSHFTPTDDPSSNAAGSLTVTVETENLCGTYTTATSTAATASLTSYSQAVYTSAHEKSAFFEGQAAFFRVAVTASDLPIQSIALLSAQVDDASGTTHVLIQDGAVSSTGTELGVVFDPQTDDLGTESVFRIPSLALDVPSGSPVFTVAAGEYTQVTVSATVSVEYADGSRRRMRVLAGTVNAVKAVNAVTASTPLSVFPHPFLTNPSTVSAQQDAVRQVMAPRRTLSPAVSMTSWYYAVVPACGVVVFVLALGLRRYRSWRP